MQAVICFQKHHLICCIQQSSKIAGTLVVGAHKCGLGAGDEL